MNTKDLHPELGSGALREALEDMLSMHGTEHPKGLVYCRACTNARRLLSPSSPIEPTLREITIQEFAAELYQICGALNAPAPVLDQLSAAASGRPLPYTTLLPFPDPQASSEIREAADAIATCLDALNEQNIGLMKAAIRHQLTLLAPSRQGAGGK